MIFAQHMHYDDVISSILSMLKVHYSTHYRDYR
jgi:hypothetical protein